MPASIPMMYSPNTTSPAHGPKKAAESSPYTGSLAEQDMKGISRMVIRRSFSFSMVRAPIMAGTEQPKPMSMGMNALPDRPKCRRVRSMTKAALAMYPLSSKNARARNRMKILGRKVRILHPGHDPVHHQGRQPG